MLQAMLSFSSLKQAQLMQKQVLKVCDLSYIQIIDSTTFVAFILVSADFLFTAGGDSKIKQYQLGTLERLKTYTGITLSQ
jgi:hypothetical protein